MCPLTRGSSLKLRKREGKLSTPCASRNEARLPEKKPLGGPETIRKLMQMDGSDHVYKSQNELCRAKQRE